MTDTPPPDDPARPAPPPGADPSEPGPPPSGARYPGPPPGDWSQPPAPAGRVRLLTRRLRGSRVAIGVAGVVVAAALVLGGVAIGHEGFHDGSGDGREHSGTSARRDAHGGGGRDVGRGGRDGDSGAGDGERGRGNGNTGNGSTSQQVLGTITALSSSSITLRTTGGTPTYPLTATTPVTRGGSAASVANLKVGDAVVLRVVTVTTGAAPVVAGISAG